MQADQSTAPDALKAPLFASLIEKLTHDKRCVVLDLGTAHGEIIQLFSQYRCRLDIADLPTSLETLRQVDEPELLQALVEKLMPAKKAEKADLVLCWDLLNYLEPASISILMAAVSERMRPGALVHMLITFSATHMPAQPCRYGATASGQLIQYPVTTAERHAPQYPPKVLGERLEAFDLDRAMLLRNGMQEYVFRLRKPGELAKTVGKVKGYEFDQADLADVSQFVK